MRSGRHLRSRDAQIIQDCFVFILSLFITSHSITEPIIIIVTIGGEIVGLIKYENPSMVDDCGIGIHAVRLTSNFHRFQVAEVEYLSVVGEFFLDVLIKGFAIGLDRGKLIGERQPGLRGHDPIIGLSGHYGLLGSLQIHQVSSREITFSLEFGHKESAKLCARVLGYVFGQSGFGTAQRLPALIHLLDHVGVDISVVAEVIPMIIAFEILIDMTVKIILALEGGIAVDLHLTEAKITMGDIAVCVRRAVPVSQKEFDYEATFTQDDLKKFIPDNPDDDDFVMPDYTKNKK